MSRKDSGFVESYFPTIDQEQTTVHRSHTAPTCRRKTKRSPTDSVSSIQDRCMKDQRPTSEKRSKPSREKSTTSSSENSTTRSKSKGRGHSSRPSSHRTSCTIVDPTRPARHYRIQSSHTVPTANGRDIDDVLALHFRSCSLFTHPSGSLNPALSQGDPFVPPSATSRFSSDEMPVVAEMVLPKQSEEHIVATEATNTPMHWTSPCSRRRDYERIDKANSGLRGLIRRAVPRCVSGPQEKFYEEDQSDTCSVRRYRMDDLDVEINEKGAARPQATTVERPATRSGMTKKKWGCF